MRMDADELEEYFSKIGESGESSGTATTTGASARSSRSFPGTMPGW